MTLPRVFFGLYAVAALSIAVGDVFLADTVGAGTSWGIAPGWMREIACFDALVIFWCVIAIRGSAEVQRVCAGGLALLSLLIASNNLAGYIDSGRSAHLGGAALHTCAMAVALVVVRRSADRHPS